MAAVAHAEGRNLDVRDFASQWQSVFPTTQGEIDEFEFYSDGHVRFLRKFKDTTKQELKAQNVLQSEGVAIIDFLDNGSLRYELVLAGRVLDDATKQLFGTMFMYEPNGHLFNGLPISFAPHPPESRLAPMLTVHNVYKLQPVAATPCRQGLPGTGSTWKVRPYETSRCTGPVRP